MPQHAIRASQRPLLMIGATVAAVAAACTDADPVSAQLIPIDRGYVGPAFLQIPGIKGNAREPAHRNWIRTEAHYWDVAPMPASAVPQAGQVGRPGQGGQGAQSTQRQSGQASAQGQGQGGRLNRARMFSLPPAPAQGQGTLIVSLDKSNPALSGLMQRCTGKVMIPEAIFSVDSDRARGVTEIGPRPDGIPAILGFKLKNVQLADCPVAAAAPEQAIVVKFEDIEWLGWQPQTKAMPVQLQPAVLPALPKLSGSTRAWVLTWIAVAHDVSDDQCPKMAERPTEADYYAFVPKEEAAQERARLASQGGPNFQNGQMGHRGPSRLNVTMLPGIVPDPGQPEPQTKVARGLDLDFGKGPKHREYVSAEGKVTGIDNQLYTVQGCIAGWMGHKGFITEFANGQMRDGQMSFLFEVSGIDDEKNDDEVYLSIYYSRDAMAKSGSGKDILPHYTFNVSTDAEFTHYYSRVRARIVDGVLTTDSMKTFKLNLGGYGEPPELKLADARISFELKPDGTIQGVIGGYRDWRKVSSKQISSTVEFYFGFQQPGMYNALKRNADGMWNPVTKEYEGISTAFDIEGVPAFAMPAAQKIASTEGLAD